MSLPLSGAPYSLNTKLWPWAGEALHAAWAALRIVSSAETGKVSALRPLGHMALAYAVSGLPTWDLAWRNALMLVTLLAALSLVDDYCDWQWRREENAVARLAKMTARPFGWVAGWLACCALAGVPWCLMVLRGAVPLASVGATLGGALWVASYTLPPFALKLRPRLKLWVAPVAAALLFIQSYTLGHEPTGLMLALAVWCFGLQGYAELVHVLDDAPTPGVPPAIPAAQTRRFLAGSQLAMAGYAMICVAWWPIAGLSVLCALLRFAFARQATDAQVHRWRRQLWHPFWALYDIAIYLVIGLMAWLP